MRGRGNSAFPRQRLLIAAVLAGLLGLAGWALLAAAGPDRHWVALLWLISAAGLVPALMTLTDRSDTMTHRLGVAGLSATAASALTVVLAAGVAGKLAVPFLPLLIAYTTVLVTTGKEAPQRQGSTTSPLLGRPSRTAVAPGASEVTAKRAGPERT